MRSPTASLERARIIHQWPKAKPPSDGSLSVSVSLRSAWPPLLLSCSGSTCVAPPAAVDTRHTPPALATRWREEQRLCASRHRTRSPLRALFPLQSRPPSPSSVDDVTTEGGPQSSPSTEPGGRRCSLRCLHLAAAVVVVGGAARAALLRTDARTAATRYRPQPSQLSGRLPRRRGEGGEARGRVGGGEGGQQATQREAASPGRQVRIEAAQGNSAASRGCSAVDAADVSRGQ